MQTNHRSEAAVLYSQTHPLTVIFAAKSARQRKNMALDVGGGDGVMLTNEVARTTLAVGGEAALSRSNI